MDQRMINLSEEQIERLFAFVRSRFVEHYDVQVELVDHLATAIEEKFESNPQKDFETALKEVYKSFGPVGFLNFMESKAAAVHNNALRQWWQEFLMWFRWPKMVATMSLIIAVYLLLQTVRADSFIYGSTVLSIIFLLYYFIKGKWKMGLKKKYRLLTLNPINFALFNSVYFAGFMPFYIAQFVSGGEIPTMLPDWMNWILAFWFAFVVLFAISCLIVRKRVLEKSRMMYPEAFISGPSEINAYGNFTG